jgi:hypothetical protein
MLDYNLVTVRDISCSGDFSLQTWAFLCQRKIDPKSKTLKNL